MFTVAVTGVGGGVGQSILKSLADSDYNLIALDGDLFGAGLYSTKKSYIIPYADDSNYIDKLLEICKEEKIDLLFPGLDAELMPLSLNREVFKAIGTTVVVSNPDVIKVSEDKQETYNRLKAIGANIPYTCSIEELTLDEIKFPILLKQKVGGARSKHIYLIHSISEWNSTIEKIGKNSTNFIVMDYIEGDEYTCGTINLDNVCKGVIVMRRILRDGDTYKCFTEKNDMIEKEVRCIVDTIKPFGACNIQLRVKNGQPYIFEINARCSGTTAARTLSGFNEPKMIADYLLKGLEPNFEIKEQTILRYWNELVIDNQTVQELKKNGKLNQSNLIKL